MDTAAKKALQHMPHDYDDLGFSVQGFGVQGVWVSGFEIEISGGCRS